MLNPFVRVIPHPSLEASRVDNIAHILINKGIPGESGENEESGDVRNDLLRYIRLRPQAKSLLFSQNDIDDGKLPLLKPKQIERE